MFAAFHNMELAPAVEERAGEMSIVLNKYPEIRMCTASRFPQEALANSRSDGYS
jgi:hypothetical protein